jgi:hypothetical protein
MIILFKRIFLFFTSLSYFIYRNICDKINFFFRKFKKFEINLDKITRNSLNSDKKTNILMIDTVHQRLNIYTDCIIAEYLQNIFNCNITGILSKNDNQSKNFYKFINTKANIELNESSILEKLKFFFKAFNIIKHYNSNDIKKFIKIEIDEINLGRSVYDHIIRSTGRVNHNELNARFVNFLTDALYFKNKFVSIFKENTYDYLILSEVQFLPSNILIQIALKYDVKVISRIYGPKKIGVRVYKNFNERFQSNHKITNKLFLELSKNKIDEYSKLGFKKITDIFEKKTNNPDFYAKHVIKSQNNFENKFDLLKHFNWDPKKKICTIFSHNMIDGNFSDELKLFIDVKTWMEITLKIIKEYGEEINWIIRAHPSEKYFPKLKTKTMDIFEEIIGQSDNIKLCPEDCAPNTVRLLSNIAVTSHGSIGVEYPCFGIPSIICGDSYYKGNGFVNEPETINEYSEILKNLNVHIKKGLTTDQIKLARAFYYIHEYLIQIDCPLLDEKFDISDKENFAQFIKDANILRKKYNIDHDQFFKKFNQQINNNQSFFQ